MQNRAALFSLKQCFSSRPHKPSQSLFFRPTSPGDVTKTVNFISQARQPISKISFRSCLRSVSKFRGEHPMRTSRTLLQGREGGCRDGIELKVNPARYIQSERGEREFPSSPSCLYFVFFSILQEGFVFRPRLKDTINICAFKCSRNIRVGCTCDVTRIRISPTGEMLFFGKVTPPCLNQPRYKRPCLMKFIKAASERDFLQNPSVCNLYKLMRQTYASRAEIFYVYCLQWIIAIWIFSENIHTRLQKL